jgi:type I restriction enzyme R subunit
VDYFGVTKHLTDALAIYTDKDKSNLNEFLEVFRDINKEIPILEARYKRLLDLFGDNALNEIAPFLQQNFKYTTREFEFAEACIVKA